MTLTGNSSSYDTFKVIRTRITLPILSSSKAMYVLTLMMSGSGGFQMRLARVTESGLIIRTSRPNDLCIPPLKTGLAEIKTPQEQDPSC